MPQRVSAGDIPKWKLSEQIVCKRIIIAMESKRLDCSISKLFKPSWVEKKFDTEKKGHFRPDCVVRFALDPRYQNALVLNHFNEISCPIIELKNQSSFIKILELCRQSANPHIVFISESGWPNPYYEEEHGIFLQWLQSLNNLLKFKISVVIVNAMYGSNGCAVTNPLDAVYLGLVKVFAKENPNVHVNNCVVNSVTHGVLSRLDELEKFTNQLSPVFLTQESYAFIELEPIEVTSHVNPVGFKNKGCYLIIGGHNGLDIFLAKYLCQNYQAETILINSSSMEEQDERCGGAQIRREYGDLTAENTLKNIIEKYPNINGIIHADFAIDHSPIIATSQKKLIDVLTPQVKSTINLMKALVNKSLDFVLFFSAIQSFVTNLGQANYTAACLAREAIANLIKNTLGIKVRIINWGNLGDRGIESRFYRDLMEYKGIREIPSEEILSVIEQSLQKELDQVVVLKATDNALCRMGVIKKEEIANNFEKSRLLPEFDFTQDHILYAKGMMDSLANYARNKFYQVQTTSTAPQKYGKLCEALAHIEYSPSPARADLIDSYPEIVGYLKLMDACIDNLPSILCDEISPLSIMFPDGSFELVEPTYRNNPVSDYYNQRVAEAVETYVNKYAKDGRVVRILEIGAGTGSTSEKVLPKLFGKSVHYIYTDISFAFLNKAKEEFSNYDFIEYRIFNAENPEEIQPVDIVLATNVIHATQNVQQSINNIFMLLKNNGLLILNEMTERYDYATLTFGLTDGWWLGEENFRIPYSPLLSLEAWEMVLHQAGFSEFYNHGGYGQHIIEAHKGFSND
ncbi:KR domain-containing protein [Chromobacterium vaccinii]|nr:KR domain-containing protein [Chromobacterium vaccinii]